MSEVLNAATLLGMLNTYRSGTLATAKIHLFVGSTTPTIHDNVDSYEEVSADWYSAVTATFGTVYANPLGSISSQARSQQFSYGSSSEDAVVVGGWYVTNSASDTVLAAGKLDAPKTMGSSLDAVVVEPRITLLQNPG